MSSKESILNSIRHNNKVQEVALPNIENFGITFENKMEQFSKVIQTVGGKALQCHKNELNQVIEELYPEAVFISSNVEEYTLATVKENELKTPHELENLDLAIVKAEFAVAENGAVWMKNPSNKHRALYFIANNIVIIVSKDDIVNNMHEAYERIEFEKAGYGVFISGPSKTADIEQSLVIGAHGPKSGYVIFV
ncbi:MAG: LUD domain-containing protein [Arcobacteraceae bacterium]|jgi:L-lactate dehydrogenase complex protein LldG|nr:LUD domain-containing protein [Arcobacteraceae bacterium]MDX9795554.1 LUD domain-containing protein [Arcobacteraceae bacterium]